MPKGPLGNYTQEEADHRDELRELLRSLWKSVVDDGADSVVIRIKRKRIDTMAIMDAIEVVWDKFKSDGSRNVISHAEKVASYIAENGPIDDMALFLWSHENTKAATTTKEARRFLVHNIKLPAVPMEKVEGKNTSLIVAKDDKDVATLKDDGYKVVELSDRGKRKSTNNDNDSEASNS